MKRKSLDFIFYKDTRLKKLAIGFGLQNRDENGNLLPTISENDIRYEISDSVIKVFIQNEEFKMHDGTWEDSQYYSAKDDAIAFIEWKTTDYTFTEGNEEEGLKDVPVKEFYISYLENREEYRQTKIATWLMKYFLNNVVQPVAEQIGHENVYLDASFANDQLGDIVQKYVKKKLKIGWQDELEDRMEKADEGHGYHYVGSSDSDESEYEYDYDPDDDPEILEDDEIDFEDEEGTNEEMVFLQTLRENNVQYNIDIEFDFAIVQDNQSIKNFINNVISKYSRDQIGAAFYGDGSINIACQTNGSDEVIYPEDGTEFAIDLNETKLIMTSTKLSEIHSNQALANNIKDIFGETFVYDLADGEEFILLDLIRNAGNKTRLKRG